MSLRQKYDILDTLVNYSNNKKMLTMLVETKGHNANVLIV